MSEMGVTWDAATFLPPPRPRGAVSGPWPIETGAHQMAVASLSLCLRLNRNFSYKMQSPALAPPPPLGPSAGPSTHGGAQGPRDPQGFLALPTVACHTPVFSVLRN